MRLAFLITAYDQPAQLARLVRALDGPRSHCYVHVDGHVPLEPFRTALEACRGVHLLADRVRVQWMGFSQVESILALLRTALRDGFDYCVLLSGSDYPIQPMARILDFYSRATEEFITFWRLADRPGWLHKIEHFYPIDWIPILPWAKNLPGHYWTRLFWGRYIHQWRQHLPRRRFPFAGMAPYGGSDWWSISGDCAREILEFVDTHPAYSRFYRYTECPSEMFFHTIVLNSPRRERVRGWARYEAWSAATPADAKKRGDAMLPEDSFNLRYIDWSGARTGLREQPAILDERDWPALAGSDDLFARKFHPRTSAALLDRIDCEILAAA